MKAMYGGHHHQYLSDKDHKYYLLCSCNGPSGPYQKWRLAKGEELKTTHGKAPTEDTRPEEVPDQEAEPKHTAAGDKTIAQAKQDLLTADVDIRVSGICRFNKEAWQKLHAKRCSSA